MELNAMHRHLNMYLANLIQVLQYSTQTCTKTQLSNVNFYKGQPRKIKFKTCSKPRTLHHEQIFFWKQYVKKLERSLGVSAKYTAIVPVHHQYPIALWFHINHRGYSITPVGTHFIAGCNEVSWSNHSTVDLYPQSWFITSKNDIYTSVMIKFYHCGASLSEQHTDSLRTKQDLSHTSRYVDESSLEIARYRIRMPTARTATLSVATYA